MPFTVDLCTKNYKILIEIKDLSVHGSEDLTF
jgi:hypothetical protein